MTTFAHQRRRNPGEAYVSDPLAEHTLRLHRCPVGFDEPRSPAEAIEIVSTFRAYEVALHYLMVLGGGRAEP